MQHIAGLTAVQQVLCFLLLSALLPPSCAGLGQRQCSHVQQLGVLSAAPEWSSGEAAAGRRAQGCKFPLWEGGRKMDVFFLDPF